MLSRARKLSNLLLVGFTVQVEELLRRGPPIRLITVTEMLEKRAQNTLARYSDMAEVKFIAPSDEKKAALRQMQKRMKTH